MAGNGEVAELLRGDYYNRFQEKINRSLGN